jgi:hypothetical protein
VDEVSGKDCGVFEGEVMRVHRPKTQEAGNLYVNNP